jgi:tetratricopeptide (TPR) repeat protein
LYSDLNVARRAALHRQTAEALRQRYEDGRDRFLAPLAYHMAQAADGSNAAEAVRYAELAAEHAAGQVAYDEAGRFYELALRAQATMDDPDEAERCRLLIALGKARYRAGEGPAAGQAFQDAAALAKKLDRADLFGQAALGFGEVRQVAGFVDQPLIALLREALGALDQADSPLRARLLARLTAALYHSATHEELMRLAAASVDMARRLYDARTLLYVLLRVHFYRFAQRDVRSRLAAAGELLDLADKIGDRDAALAACRARIIDLVEDGDAEALAEGMRAYSERALESRQPLHIHLNVLCRAMRALLDGSFDEAEALAREALELGRDAQDDTAIASQAFAVQLFGIRKEQGLLGELEPVVASLVERYPALPSWRVALAHIYSETGKLDEARAALTPISSDNFAGLPDDYNRPIALTLLAETCATLQATHLAAGLYDLLLPLDRRCAVAAGMSATVGSASRHLGLLATTMGRWDDAERHFADALEQNTRLQAPPLVAHTQVAWASMLLARGDAVDRDRAFEMLRAADSTASRLSMQRLSEITTGLLATAS